MSVRDSHHKAMAFAEHALLARIQGHREDAIEFSKKALEHELVAIRKLDERGERAEPTWSVLHRSAGWLAFNSNQVHLSGKLARKALAGNPHPEIADELRELLVQIYRSLEKDLIYVRWQHAGFESEKEDPILDAMEEVWYKLSEEEQQLLYAERTQSLIRNANENLPHSCCTDGNIWKVYSSTPVRPLREVA